MKLHVALCAATLLLAAAQAAPSPATQKTQQSSKATLDFIAHEQSQGAGQAAPAAPVRGAVLTTPPPRFSSSDDTQQHLQHNHHQQRVNASSMPKKDWELVPSTPRPSAQRPTLPSVQRPTPPSVQRPTLPSVQRPTPPTYAGVVKDHSHDHGHGQQERTSTPRVYHIPISVEQGYTTSTEASRWYDKLFGKGLDSDDDSPWGRRRRQVAASQPEQPQQPRSEIVIGSNAIRVAGASPPARTQPAKRQ